MPLAKLFEGADHAVFEATGQWVSGHSLKHLLAAGAALPVLAAGAVRTAGRSTCAACHGVWAE
jgi:mono/diheme cytochrome c family protein